MEQQEELNRPEDEKRSVLVTDDYLIEIVQAFNNLIEEWKAKIKSGRVNLPFVVHIGRRLNHERQRDFLAFSQDVNIPDKYLGKVLHAFAINLPVWSIHTVLHIYKLADKTKGAIVMYNDLMDEFEAVFHQFEYDFLEGLFPEESEQLEQALNDVEIKLQTLYNRAPAREKTQYNRFYGDSSTTSSDRVQHPAGCSFQTLIGVPEDATEAEIRKQGRLILKKLHPDTGGSAYLFDWVKKAYDEHSMLKHVPLDPL